MSVESIIADIEQLNDYYHYFGRNRAHLLRHAMWHVIMPSVVFFSQLHVER